MLSGIEVAKEVVVLNIDVIQKMWKKFIGIDLSVKDGLLEEWPVLPMEYAVVWIPSTEGKNKFLRRLRIC